MLYVTRNRDRENRRSTTNMSSVNQQNIDVGNDDYDKLIRAQTIGRMTQ